MGLTKNKARCERLGLPTEIGSCDCPLPHHPRHKAELVERGGVAGIWQVVCPRLDRAFSFADLRAINSYVPVPYYDPAQESKLVGSLRDIRPPTSKNEQLRWAELLDYEAGLLAPSDVPLLVPANLTPRGVVAAQQVKLLVGLRSEAFWTEEDRLTFTFARRFCMARCGFSSDVARAALSELIERRVIERIGKSRAAILFRVVTDPPRGATTSSHINRGRGIAR